MKKIKAIFSVFMLSALMLSTVGFTVSRHYCLGMLKAESFYAPAEKCSGEEQQHHESGEHISMNCCSDELLAIPGVQVLSKVPDYGKNISPSLPSILFTFCSLKAEVKTEQNHFLPPTTAPPISGKQLLIKVQRFLI